MTGWSEQQTDFNKFCEQVRKRMEAGHREYGDGSFARPPTDLTQEISEEITDIMGWAFILWCRLQTLHKTLQEQDDGNI